MLVHALFWVNTIGQMDIDNHLLNFVAPAAAVALVLVLSGRLVGSRSASAMSVRQRWAILFAVGVAVLTAGLVLWGRDGKMLKYAALVVACATCQWLLVRGCKA